MLFVLESVFLEFFFSHWIAKFSSFHQNTPNKHLLLLFFFLFWHPFQISWFNPRRFNPQSLLLWLHLLVPSNDSSSPWITYLCKTLQPWLYEPGWTSWISAWLLIRMCENRLATLIGKIENHDGLLWILCSLDRNNFVIFTY